MAHQPSPLERELVVVTGKGGVGKTTVAAALALLAGRRDGRTIVCEVAGQRRIPGVLGHPTAGAPGAEEPVAPGLWATTIDPEGALAEWAGRLVRPRALVELAVRSRTLSGFVHAAPGARELVTITKAWELGRRPRWLPEREPYDRVILDAPASGHGLGLLRTPRTYAEIARVGPIAHQSRLVDELIGDPERCAVVVVTTAEETPVNEALELEERLTAELGHGPALLVADSVLGDPLSPADLAAAGAHLREPVAAALHRRHDRALLQAAQLRRLRRGAHAPVVTLPHLGARAIGPDDLAILADRLRRALARLGGAPARR